MRRIFLLPLLLTAAASAQVQLSHPSEPGKTVRRLITVVTEGPRGEVTLSGTLMRRVAAKNEDGSFIQESALQGVTIVAGETRQVVAEMSLPLVKLGPQGRVLEQIAEETDPETLLQDRLLAVILPAKTIHTGDSWTHSEPASHDVPEIGTIFRYVSREVVAEVQCAKIAWSSAVKQGSIGTNGTAWISIETGEVVKLDANIDNLPVGGEPVRARIEIRPVT